MLWSRCSYDCYFTDKETEVQLSNIPKVTDLVSSKVRICIRVAWLQGPALNQKPTRHNLESGELSKLQNTNGQKTHLF